MKTFLLSLLLCCCLPGFSQPKTNVLPRPKLVVGIVVDQMRWDYLYRYYDRYGQGGFKRLLNEGFSCENTYINYIPTVTAIGHSTVYTGSVPAIHGIAGNEFIIQATGKTMYCAEDTAVQSVGGSVAAGRMSPKNLLASTITDELKLATNFRSKVIGVALKDRGSILPAGHAADAAYWFDDSTGGWMTSTYYMASLPAWVKTFNDRKLPAQYLKQDWNTLYDISTYVQSSKDDNLYEGRYGTNTKTTFPIQTSTLYMKDFSIIRSTPYGNTLTNEMAKAAVVNEKLGKGIVTDFLTVSYSSTDYIGHKMGVNAIETEDTYLRLDKDLAEFFNFLDKQVGKGAYTVFLTADHGAAHNPNFLQDNRIPAGYWRSSQVLRDLNAVLEATYKEKAMVISFSNYQVHLNNQLIEKRKLDRDSIVNDIVKYLTGKPGISFVVDNTKVAASGIPEKLRTRIQNGYNYKRSGIISIIPEPGFYSGSGSTATGTTHGTWNAYDAHIPLLWMGWGIRHGTGNKRVDMTDISSTLAALLHIEEPDGCIGEPIVEVMK